MPGSMGPSVHYLREQSLCRLYVILFLSFCYFIVQMAIAHITHALILQIDAYHMLYNILGICTSIITTKMCKDGSSLKNTFGWTRIDVCGAVSSLCFLAALCFSLVVEALQSMFHAAHHERMSLPYLAAIVGLAGIAVNAVVFISIGGFSYHQQGFVGWHKAGDPNNVMISPAARRGPDSPKRKCGGPMDAFRDFFGCILVVIVAVVIYFFDENEGVLTYVDPSLTIFYVVVIGIALYKFAKEAGHILLLTIPNNIDVKTLIDEVEQSFPEIYGVHELHVWQLSPSRVVATAHVVFHTVNNCWVVLNNVNEFLQMKGISSVTLQPEFLDLVDVGASPQTLKKRQCFLPCKEEDDCHEKKCCLSDDAIKTLAEKNMAHGHSHGAGGGHSHGGERSQSLQNLKMKDNELSTTPKLRKPVKSTPALNTDKATTSTLGTPNSASTSSSATGSFGKASTITTEVDVVVSAASRQTHSDDSDDDDHHERKPMI